MSPEDFTRLYQSITGTLEVDGNPGRETLRTLIGPVSIPAVFRAFHDAPSANIERFLPLIFAALRDHRMLDRQMSAMALATIRAETAGFYPLREMVSKLNTRDTPFDLYDDRADLGNRGAPDGRLFPGRGFIQLTGRDNYRVIGEAIGVDLIAKPEIANEPWIAARVLAEFLRRREDSIRQALDRHDLPTARRIVNGGRHGLDRFTRCYELLILSV